MDEEVLERIVQAESSLFLSTLVAKKVITNPVIAVKFLKDIIAYTLACSQVEEIKDEKIIHAEHRFIPLSIVNPPIEDKGEDK